MIWLIIFLFVIPFLAFLVYLALSSCLGNSLRQQGVPRPSYGRAYFRNIAASGAESIEMADMLGAPGDEDDEDWNRSVQLD